MLESVTLLGSSSGRNAGDAALLSGIMDTIDEACGARLRYEIPTIKPGFVARSYANDVYPISMLPWHGSIKMLGLPTFASVLKTDLTLVFDAILFDRALLNPLFNHLSTLYVLLPLAKRRGKIIGAFNVCAGPVNTPLGQKMLREICNLMDFITVRDEGSFEVLKRIGVTNPRIAITADAALNVQAASAQRAQELIRSVGLDPSSEILALNVSKYIDTWLSPTHTPVGRERFLREYSAAISAVAKETNAQLLFVCTQHHDVPLTAELLRLVEAPKKGLISNRECSHYEIKAVLAQAALLFGMRLHATILATSELTPSIALPHQPKLNYFFQTLDLNERVFDFSKFSAGALREHVLNGWRDRSELRRHLERVIPVEKEKAKVAAKIVAALHRGEDIAQFFR